MRKGHHRNRAHYPANNELRATKALLKRQEVGYLRFQEGKLLAEEGKHLLKQEREHPYEEAPLKQEWKPLHEG